MTRSRLTALPDGCPGAARRARRSASLLRASAASAADRARRPPAAATAAAPVVVVGTGGLTWSDVSPTATPALWSLLRARRDRLADGALGAQQHLPGGRLADPVGRAAGRRPRHRRRTPGRRAGPLREPAADGAVPRLGHLPPHRGGQGLRRPPRPARRRADPRRRLRPRGRPRRRAGARRPPPARSPATRRTTPAPCRATLAACPVDAGRRRRGARPGRRRPARRGPPERLAGARRSGRSTPGSGRCWPPRRPERGRARREPVGRRRQRAAAAGGAARAGRAAPARWSPPPPGRPG